MLNTIISRIECIEWQQPQLNLEVLPACQPLLFLTCHVTFDLSSVYYNGCMLSFADLMRPSRAETSRLKLPDSTCQSPVYRLTELVNG
jgi:hypothetical protein